MAYLPELHYCCVCKEYLGPDNGDGICPECDTEENAELEYDGIEEEQPEHKYHTWDEANDRGYRQSDFV
jgi:uncharacterized Zn finger protein (UPF0148 family)